MLKLRSYQTEAIDALYTWFQQNDGNPLIVLPTGSGKSLVQAKIFEDALAWPNTRCLSITHSQELISQNHAQLMRLWPEAPAGIYSAGLGKKQHHHQITFAGIQSVFKKPELIGWRDLITIDECHLVGDSDAGMYRQFLAGMRRINPDVRLIGLSATPWRLKSGLLHRGPNAMFSGIAYELPILRLVNEGYLTPLVNKAAVAQGDTDKLALQGGDFKLTEANSEFDRQAMTSAAVDEMLAKGSDRKAWLVFCILKEHAEHVKEALLAKGIHAACITDATPAGERARLLREFKSGQLRALTSVGIFTTGFDSPNVDLIALLRPTMSPGLLVQMLGRGMRPVYAMKADLSTDEGRRAGIAGGEKQNCLVLDFAGNLERHGPVTHIRAPETSRRLADKDGKVCQNCRAVNLKDATECCECGAPFAREGGERKIKHSKRASSADVMSDAPIISEAPVWLDVKNVNFEIHRKEGSADSLKVGYNCRPNYVLEWVSFGHFKEYPRKKAEEWWIARGGQLPVPLTAMLAMQRLKEISNIKPRRIYVKKDGKYDRVISYDLVPAETVMLNTGGNLGSRVTQVEESTDVEARSA
jgi:DNA repair protein RadD